MADMTNSTSPRGTAIDAFFARCSLNPEAKAHCWAYMQANYPGALIQEASAQGYCSYTFCVGPDMVVQFRPPTYQLDIALAERVAHVYGNLAPETSLVGRVQCPSQGIGRDQSAAQELLVYSMSRIGGESLTEHRRATHLMSTASDMSRYTNLARDYARLLARAWHAQLTPYDAAADQLPKKIGRSLRWRLDLMQRDLPPRFQPSVAHVLARLPQIEALPWLLTHGDVVPSNIMVTQTEDGLQLTGLLDWAEAEYLPFGVGLYGAEELLGQTTVPWDGEGPYPPPGSRFAYFEGSAALRQILWNELEEVVPALRTDADLRATVEAARDLGILLWHGIAFDDGRLDRVVQEGRDDTEIQRLDLFLLEEHGDSPGALLSRASRGLLQKRARRLSVGDAVKRMWAGLRHLRPAGQVHG